MLPPVAGTSVFGAVHVAKNQRCTQGFWFQICEASLLGEHARVWQAPRLVRQPKLVEVA